MSGELLLHNGGKRLIIPGGFALSSSSAAPCCPPSSGTFDYCIMTTDTFHFTERRRRPPDSPCGVFGQDLYGPSGTFDQANHTPAFDAIFTDQDIYDSWLLSNHKTITWVDPLGGQHQYTLSANMVAALIFKLPGGTGLGVSASWTYSSICNYPASYSGAANAIPFQNRWWLPSACCDSPGGAWVQVRCEELLAYKPPLGFALEEIREPGCVLYTSTPQERWARSIPRMTAGQFSLLIDGVAQTPENMRTLARGGFDSFLQQYPWVATISAELPDLDISGLNPAALDGLIDNRIICQDTILPLGPALWNNGSFEYWQTITSFERWFGYQVRTNCQNTGTNSFTSLPLHVPRILLTVL